MGRIRTTSLALCLAFLAAPSASEARSYPSLFNSAEQRSDNLTAFPKWRGALNRSLSERRAPEDCGGRRCHLQSWQSFIDGIRHLGPLAQLEAVNREMNRRRYIIDPRNWGVEDYWASPLQFFRKQGDCEDYAISKFMSLRALGFANDDLRIVVLQDLNLRVGHAVLVAYLKGKAYILDNQIPTLITADRIRHYKPFYSINETSWWLHRTGS